MINYLDFKLHNTANRLIHDICECVCVCLICLIVCLMYVNMNQTKDIKKMIHESQKIISSSAKKKKNCQTKTTVKLGYNELGC